MVSVLDHLEGLERKELINVAKKIHSEKISVLGEGECFVRKGSNGFAESVKVNVTLSEFKKEIYSLGDKWCISADGYDKLNQAAGLSIINPATINIGGTETGNPHFEMDDDGIKSVTVRRIVVGPAPIGNMVAIERLLRLDLNLYFLEDLQAKVRKRKGCGGYGTKEVKPKTIPEGNTAVCFSVGPASLWVDLEHVDIQDAFSGHVKRCKYAERIATRICERNALASHPAIARRHVEPVGGIVTVPVFGGRMITDEKRIIELTEAWDEGNAEKLKEIAVVKAEGIEEAKREDVEQVEEVEGDEFSPSEESSPSGETEEKSEKPAPVKKTAAWKKAHDQIQGFKEMDPQVYFKIIEEEGIRNLNTMTTRELNKLKKRLESS